MVVYDNMKMFDLAVECGAAINILNNQNLTPLSTASFLARTEMFFHIANLEREVYWQIGTYCVNIPIYNNICQFFVFPQQQISLYVMKFQATLLVRRILLHNWTVLIQRQES